MARLGTGGMGVVYLGRSPAGRAAAVKVVREGFARDARYRARFRREVAAARRVTAAFTAPLLDADPEAAVPWLATEYLPGLTLREAVGTYGALPPTATKLLAAALAEALTAIHRAGLAHRDLKPENIMLTAAGPRVIDFGIARPDQATVITVPGALLGTPGFMSPEQAAGGVAGTGSDVFALGAVLAYAATGREPFGTGDRAATLDRVRRADADLGGLDTADPALRALLMACLHREPHQRPAAAAVLDRLGDPAGSVQGTRWLPPPLAEAIDLRVARPEPPAYSPTVDADRWRHAVSTDDPPAPDAGLHVLSTADPMPGPAAPAPPPYPLQPPSPVRNPARRKVLMAAAAAASAAVATGIVLTLRDSGSGAAKAGPTGGPSPSVGSTSKPTTKPPAPTAPPVASGRWRTKVVADDDGYADIYPAKGAVLTVNTTHTTAVRALDSRTGRQKWTRPVSTEALSAHVTASGDAVYVIEERKDAGSALRAVDAADGGSRWVHTMPDFEFVWAMAAVPAGVCVTGGESVTALDAKSGRTRWQTAVTTMTITAASGLVVAESSARGTNTLTALSATDGRVRWKRKFADQPQSPLIGDDVVFVRDAYGGLFAVRADNGEPLWHKTLDTRSKAHRTGGGMLFVDDADGSVRALRATTGAEVWSRRLGQGTADPYGQSTAIGVSGDTLWVGTTDQVVYALNTADGTVRWTYGADAMNEPDSTGDPGWGALVVDGLVVLSTRDGLIEAVVPPDAASTTPTADGAVNGAPHAAT
ncbi:serine/threonine-protein kinase [Actinacidiphila alni]|uniref:serine/threonine-protein kinase n=1 Tax=Actinacidiphila alni TaxID=380248 RepID=UPI0033C32147